ncbi:MAG: beta-lactamase family protein, partial [Cryobacterium sp.]|nr:beta-lactamase family protein [Cryobacterium sp.]
AVMQLVEAGAIDLDADLSRYLDTFAGKPAGAITIRQLLSHTSGYSTGQGNAGHPESTGKGNELALAVDGMAEEAPAYKPNEKWEYSNANYEILGRVIEVVSGQDYQSYIAKHILEPVGMDHSFVADGKIHNSMATGHVPWFGTKLALADGKTDFVTAPQGGIIASASDLARYMNMMLNGEDDVLSAEGKAIMMSPASEVSPHYGFGWYVEPDSGAVWHTGISPGVETLATMLPAENKAAVVLANGGSGMGFGETDELRIGIVDKALGIQYYDAGATRNRQALFLGLVLLPIIYLLSMVWAVLRRSRVRAKRSSAFGKFSLWFPLLPTLAAAWVFLFLIPSLNGTPLLHWARFQPDLMLLFVVCGLMGVVWSLFRLGVAYSGKGARSLT